MDLKHLYKYVSLSLILFSFMISPRLLDAQQPNKPPVSRTNLQALVDEINTLILKNGLYKDSLNLEEINHEISRIRFRNVDTTNRRLILEVFTRNFRKAGDKHSFFLTT